MKSGSKDLINQNLHNPTHSFLTNICMKRLQIDSNYEQYLRVIVEVVLDHHAADCRLQLRGCSTN